jgi:hypothetical protein
MWLRLAGFEVLDATHAQPGTFGEHLLGEARFPPERAQRFPERVRSGRAHD